MLKEIDERRLRAFRAYRNAITHIIIFWAVPAVDKSNCRKSSGRNTIVWCTTTIINHIVWEKQSWLAKKKNLFLFIRKNFYEIPLPSPSIVRSSIFLAKFFISRFLSVVLLPLIYPFIRYYLAIILIFYVSILSLSISFCHLPIVSSTPLIFQFFHVPSIFLVIYFPLSSSILRICGREKIIRLIFFIFDSSITILGFKKTCTIYIIYTYI